MVADGIWVELILVWLILNSVWFVVSSRFDRSGEHGLLHISTKLGYLIFP